MEEDKGREEKVEERAEPQTREEAPVAPSVEEKPAVERPPAEGRPPEARPADGGDRYRGGRSDDRGSRPYDRGGRRPMGPKRRFFRKKFCRFCAKKMDNFSYKNADALARFVSDRGKILPRRVTGTCGKHQRVVAREIKRARLLAILPYVKS